MTLRERLLALADELAPDEPNGQLALAAARMALEDAATACEQVAVKRGLMIYRLQASAAIRALRDGLD